PMYALSVDPVDKFDGISDAAMTVLANLCLKAHQDGIFVVIRFAHEMNGEWYTWGLQPQAFIETYRRLYTTVKTISPATNFIWAPNIYPGGSNGTTYSTYYPGDSYIDWVGLSYYHFGATWPPKNKPFVIAETGAPAYSDRTKEPADLAEINQKRSWWTQVYNTTVFSQFPNLKMILWFEYTKRE
ncbi:glycoside hydrolase superfamily, partial [Paraphysoderma sedebokerense]